MRINYASRVMLCGAVLLFFTAVTGADTITHGPITIPLSTMNWSEMISVPKFNPTVGILQSIEFELSGHIVADIMLESLDSSPATVTTDVSAEIELQRPDNSVLLITLPGISTIDNVTAFDGNIDFFGGSGRTYTDTSANKTETFTSPPPAGDLLLFTGFGNINLPIIATGTASGSGAGNLVVQFNTQASAEVTVKYIYEIPEPATLMLLSLGGLALVRRWR
ncbi:MAG: PEP-CTERM sorting domain-containing protein [Planctomycetota bacterium]|nr:MAG: PEP-CTERM sorting domain-containing protein [Planctomycetota bacterium]